MRHGSHTIVTSVFGDHERTIALLSPGPVTLTELYSV